MTDIKMTNKLSRRELFRRIAGNTAGAALATTFGVPTALMLGVTSFLDSEEVTSRIEKEMKLESPHFSELNLNGTKVNLYGVSHIAKYVEEYSDQLEEKIKGSFGVVLEATPDNISKAYASAATYFGFVHDLCQKHHKPIIKLDPQSSLGAIAETTLGGWGAIAATESAFKIGRKKYNRRDLFKHIGIGSLGAYLASSSFVFGMFRAFIKSEEGYRGQYYFNHIEDQRTVLLTERLLQTAQHFKKEIPSDQYLLVNFGRNHTQGIEYYLTHPKIRAFKRELYEITYDLLSDNQTCIYLPKNGEWKKEPLLL